MANIVSSIAGRLRLRAPELKGGPVLAAQQAALAGLPGIVSATVNARTGSLLVRYDAARLSRSELEREVCLRFGIARAQNGLNAGDGLEAVPLESAPARKWKPARGDVNRYAKLGSVACMAVSLLAIAARQRRLHVWSGVAALAFAGAHMVIHRRTLLR